MLRSSRHQPWEPIWQAVKPTWPMDTPFSRSMASMPPEMEEISLPGIWSGPYSISPRSSTSPGMRFNLKIWVGSAAHFPKSFMTFSMAPTLQLPALLPLQSKRCQSLSRSVSCVWNILSSTQCFHPSCQIYLWNMFVGRRAVMPSWLPKGNEAWKRTPFTTGKVIWSIGNSSPSLTQLPHLSTCHCFHPKVANHGRWR